MDFGLAIIRMGFLFLNGFPNRVFTKRVKVGIVMNII